VDRAALSIARGATRDRRRAVIARFFRRARSVIDFLPSDLPPRARWRLRTLPIYRATIPFSDDRVVDRRQTGDGNPYGGPMRFRGMELVPQLSRYSARILPRSDSLCDSPAASGCIFPDLRRSGCRARVRICKSYGGLPIANNFINRDPISLGGLRKLFSAKSVNLLIVRVPSRVRHLTIRTRGIFLFDFMRFTRGETIARPTVVTVVIDLPRASLFRTPLPRRALPPTLHPSTPPSTLRCDRCEL